jgi:hypothetical protein
MEKENVGKIATLALRAIALAMAVAVIVLNALGTATTGTLITLLGMGLFGLAITSLDTTEK